MIGEVVEFQPEAGFMPSDLALMAYVSNAPMLKIDPSGMMGAVSGTGTVINGQKPEDDGLVACDQGKSPDGSLTFACPEPGKANGGDADLAHVCCGQICSSFNTQGSWLCTASCVNGTPRLDCVNTHCRLDHAYCNPHPLKPVQTGVDRKKIEEHCP